MEQVKSPVFMTLRMAETNAMRRSNLLGLKHLVIEIGDGYGIVKTDEPYRKPVQLIAQPVKTVDKPVAVVMSKPKSKKDYVFSHGAGVVLQADLIKTTPKFYVVMTENGNERWLDRNAWMKLSTPSQFFYGEAKLPSWATDVIE